MHAVRILAFILIAASAALAAAQQPTCTVNIHVDGFRNQRGDLGVTVFTSPAGWPEQNEKALFHSGFPITGTHATATIQLPPGRYSFAVLHDENSNHKLDRNFIGFPKEGFGFSNNPAVRLTAPGFDTAATQVACPATDVVIHLIYK